MSKAPATSLDVFWGEFLTSPIPLDLALNYCSSKCAYCFANLNTPDREANIGQITRLLAEMGTRKSLTARLLREGYPVLCANKVDVFAASNYRQALPILEMMADLGVPMAFQTRGGRGIDEALNFLQPSCWYVSICQADDADRKRIEPGAPSIESRFELIAKLKGAGHRVVLAVNPYVPEWMPDLPALFERAHGLGVEGTWIETLHLNRRQVANLSSRELVALDGLLAKAQERKRSAETRAQHLAALEAARSACLQTYHVGQWVPSTFWEPYYDTYPKLFPTSQDFVNWCWAHVEPGGVVTFADFEAVMLPDFPAADETLPILHYIGAKAHDLLRGDVAYPNQMTYRQLLAEAWKTPKLPFSPAALRCFAYEGAKDSTGDWTQFTDERDLPVLMFVPEGTDDYMIDVEARKAA